MMLIWKGNVLYLCFITALEKKCPICLGLFDEEDEVKKLPCSHRFHSTCIVPWLQRVCTVKFLNPYMTNGFSHRYHLGKTIFIFRGFRSGFEYSFSFFLWIFSKQTEYPQMGRRILWHHICGYSVYLCPIRGTPGFNELSFRHEVI